MANYIRFNSVQIITVIESTVCYVNLTAIVLKRHSKLNEKQFFSIFDI